MTPSSGLEGSVRAPSLLSTQETGRCFSARASSVFPSHSEQARVFTMAYEPLPCLGSLLHPRLTPAPGPLHSHSRSCMLSARLTASLFQSLPNHPCVSDLRVGLPSRPSYAPLLLSFSTQHLIILRHGPQCVCACVLLQLESDLPTGRDLGRFS